MDLVGSRVRNYNALDSLGGQKLVWQCPIGNRHGQSLFQAGQGPCFRGKGLRRDAGGEESQGHSGMLTAAARPGPWPPVDIISPTIIPDTCNRKRTGGGAAAVWLGRDADPQEPAPAEGAL